MLDDDFVQNISFLPPNPDVLNHPLRELYDMKYQRRQKQAFTSMNESKICGADTETIEGKLWLFSTEHGVWECQTFDDLLEVLYNREHTTLWRQGKTKTRKKRKGISTKEFFFWNLKYDAQAILRLFSDEVIDTLIVGEKVVLTAFEGTSRAIPVELTYLTGKYMEIKPVNWWIQDRFKAGMCKFWDISQFYGKMKLKTAADMFGFPPKIEKCFDGSILDVTQFDDANYRHDYKEDIEKYAIHDAVLAGELTRLKRASLIQSGIRFNQPYSEANVAQRALMDTPCCEEEVCECEHPIPTINQYRDEPRLHHLLQKALTSYHGGRFECSGNGFLKNCIAIDLASAYAFTQYHLPNTSKGYWIQRDDSEQFFEYLENREPMSLGFAEITVMFEDGLDWYPLVKVADNGTLVAPRYISGWFCMEEIAEAYKWPHTTFIVGEWLEFREADSNDRPFRPFLDKFYQMKVDAGVARKGCECGRCKPCIDYKNAKVMICSTYGKTMQAIDGKTGMLWNPFWASQICGATRARLAELIRLNDFKAVSVATDGVIFKKEDLKIIPNRPLPACHNLGQWEIEAEGDLLVIQSGVYSMKTDTKTKTVFRGSSSYFLGGYRKEGLFGFVDDNADVGIVTTTRWQPYTASEARVRGDYSLINRFRENQYSIKTRGDSQKRLWGFNQPRVFADLLTRWYSSRPHQQLETAVRLTELTD